MPSADSTGQEPQKSGIQVQTTIATLEKAALPATTVTAFPNSFERSPCPSGHTSPGSDRSQNPFDTDVEAMMTNGSTDKHPRPSVVINRQNDAQVWPGKDHWKQRAKAAKRQRSCTYMSRLDRRTRIAVKILVIVLVIGIGFAVGFGISKPLGAPIWGKNVP
ncbi:hypothetical protein CP533_5993 [Ophiocordyceps camponoti-saundersi (nom. inval.)]|nr:hypothetical protein CP533_5993 [Ophiocordyceps camponoti-saundersi (nom. inval.)]